MTRRCDECGVDLGPPGDGPEGGRKWCSEECADKATAGEGWIRVADLTPVQRAELDAIVAPPTDILSPEVARALLDHLRPSEDKPLTNCFGERCWLQPCLDGNGRRIGLTECCLVDEPCEKHAAMPHGGAS